MYMCVYIYIYIYLYSCTCLSLHTHLHIHIHTYIYICTRVCAYVHIMSSIATTTFAIATTTATISAAAYWGVFRLGVLGVAFIWVQVAFLGHPPAMLILSCVATLDAMGKGSFKLLFSIESSVAHQLKNGLAEGWTTKAAIYTHM